ncbi:MAG TPA: hypothetical protein VIL69_09280, partial [Roseomonas sp.]
EPHRRTHALALGTRKTSRTAISQLKGPEAALTTDRPGGSTYHITWSLGKGRKPVESNDVIAVQGWTALEKPRPIRLEPSVFGSQG